MIEWIMTNWFVLGQMGLAIIGLASVIVKLTPTLADDHILKEVVKFLGKFIALNNSITKSEQKKANLTYLEKELEKYK
jgi:hypothetical protein